MPFDADNDLIIEDLFKEKVKKSSKDSNDPTLATPRLPDEIILIVDCSGSMYAIKNDAEGGINAFIKEQQNVEENGANLTLVEFSNTCRVVHDRIDINSLTEPYVLTPCGTTALLDAVGTTLSKFNNEDSGKKIVVVVTDGFENSSVEYTRDIIFNMITERKEQGWEFLFLAAGQDAMAVGTNYGFNPQETINFASSGTGVKAAYDTAAVYTSSIRGCDSKIETLEKLKNYVDSNKDVLS